uniref:Uncharacterized protein n=1 Tax=Glypta fumiferanae TaxID=389681 RepID=A0A0F6Q8U3_9HYME|nr:hypothetical protein [Glypta fumiferanae]
MVIFVKLKRPKYMNNDDYSSSYSMSFKTRIGVLNIALENIADNTNVLDLCDERLNELRQLKLRYYTVVPIVIAECNTTALTSEESIIRELVSSSRGRYAAINQLPSVNRISCYEKILRRQYFNPRSQLTCAFMIIMSAATYQSGSLRIVTELAAYTGDIHLYFLVLSDHRAKLPV